MPLITCVIGKGNQIAIIYDSPVTNIKKITYEQLQNQIIQFSGALKIVVKGSVIISQ